MADYMPLILIGGLAVGGFILWKQGAFNNLFTPPAPPPAPAPTAPVSGSTSTSTTPTASSCMGTDILSGQPCPCPSASANVAYAYPGYRRYPEPSGPRRVVILPGQGFPGSFPGTSSTTCDCSRCGQSSVLGGISPSQFSTNGGDLNNFIGSSIAQAGYRI